MAKMWVMFFTSLLLVSAMNFYAVIREPDLIDIDDIHEYPRETVKVEGVLTSFVDRSIRGTSRQDRLASEGDRRAFRGGGTLAGRQGSPCSSSWHPGDR